MRVALIGPVYPYRGGIAHYTTRLARKLMETGHEVKVISFRRQYPAWLYPGESDKDPSATPLTVPAEYVLDPLYPWTWWQAVRAIDGFQPEVVALQWWTTFWAPALMGLGWMLRKKGLRPVFMIHNVLPHEQKAWDHTLARAALSQGLGFIVHTQREQERLQQILPHSTVKICPIPTYDNLATAMPKAEARKLLDVPLEMPLLLFFGIVRAYKGLAILLESLGILRARGVNFHLLIAGEFWDDKATYLQQIERLQLGACVHIEDRYIPDEEVAQIFSAADVLVAPYVGGTQSAVASWGLGFGLPLIVSDQVARGIEATNQSGITVTPTGDYQRLADALESFILRADVQRDAQLHPVAAEATGWQELIQSLAAWAKTEP